MKSNAFTLPAGVVEVTDDYQKNLAHYELLNLKPKGTILFAKETREITFQFFAGETIQDGIFARLNEPTTPGIGRILDYVEKYPRTEALITLSLLQFKMIFIVNKIGFIHGAKQKTFQFSIFVLTYYPRAS